MAYHATQDQAEFPAVETHISIHIPYDARQEGEAQ